MTPLWIDVKLFLNCSACDIRTSEDMDMRQVGVFPKTLRKLRGSNFLRNVFLLSLLVVAVVMPKITYAHPQFFYMGNGVITFEDRQGNPYRIEFRRGDSDYDELALRKINDIYGADWKTPSLRISLRLIELLDFIQDHFGGGLITIISGFRSPAENTTLRDKGRLAASSSLHIDGEAIDIVMAGVPSVDIRDFLMSLNCCGIGYYHGKAVHVDIGPPRFWDEKTSGTEAREPPMNEKIIVRTDKDIYISGEPILLQFSRVNVYPFGVKRGAWLEVQKGNDLKSFDFSPDFAPHVKRGAARDCMVITERDAARTIESRAKSQGKGETKARVRVEFCDPVTEKMPKEVTTNEFIILPKTP